MSKVDLETTSTEARARAVAAAGGIDAALATGVLPALASMSLVEALVLGLLRQGLRKYFVIFGHGNTALGEVLRLYEAAGVVRVWQFRNEVAMAHAATQLAWQYGESAAVVTSIGPGALQAYAGSVVAASNGIGVWHIYGDETTHGEGYNMQQVPKPNQGSFGILTSVMGRSYTLHTPEALRDALRRGAATVGHPYKPGPFYLLLPVNTQPVEVSVNLAALPSPVEPVPVVCAAEKVFAEASRLIASHDRVVVKVGGGGRRFPEQIRAFVEKSGAVAVLSPGSTGVLPDAHPQNMHVGGSKGSISGNRAMLEASLLVVIGSRAVCQSDCSGIGYPNAAAVINLNGDYDDLSHYNRTLGIPGDIGMNLERLTAALPAPVQLSAGKSEWLDTCEEAKRQWTQFKHQRFASPAQLDPVWHRKVMTQPQAIRVVAEFAKLHDAVKLFDAGDVQANGFQIVEDDRPYETFTETGASYMGYAVSALMAGAAADNPRYAIAFTGDGSFMMNPQILLDAVEHGLHATIVLFDNRRMAAITSLQLAQYGAEFRTSDGIAVDYVHLANAFPGILALSGGDSRQALQSALERAREHAGLSIIHLPVYGGAEKIGGMGAYGAWNVGNWVTGVEEQYLRTLV